MDTNNAWIKWLFIVGVVVVFGTHVYMLIAGLPATQMVPHAIVNLIAACLIVAGWISSRV